jgi:hypothetical protein
MDQPKKSLSIFSKGATINTASPISLSTAQKEQGAGLGADNVSQYNGIENEKLHRNLIKERQEVMRQAQLEEAEAAMTIQIDNVEQAAKKNKGLQEAKKLILSQAGMPAKEKEAKLAQIKQEEEVTSSTIMSNASAAMANSFVTEMEKVVKQTKQKVGEINVVKAKSDTETVVGSAATIASAISFASGSVIKNFVLPLSSYLVELGAETKNAKNDTEKEIDKRSKLNINDPKYIDKEKYQKAQAIVEKVKNPIAGELHKIVDTGLSALEGVHKQNTKKDKYSDTTFSSDKIKYTFTKNSLQRTKELIEAYQNKEGGSDIWAKELLGKTIATTGGSVHVLENLRNSQYEFWFKNEVTENLQKNLDAYAKSKNKKVEQLDAKEMQGVFAKLPLIDQEVLKSTFYENTVKSLVEDDLTWSYKAVRDTGASVDFMLSMVAGGAISKVVGKGFQAAATAARASRFASTIKGAQTLQKVLQANGRAVQVMQALPEIGQKMGKTLMRGAATEYINPKNLTGSNYSLYKPILKDPSKGVVAGNVLAVVGREGAYALAKQDTERDKKIYQNIYNNLKQNEGQLSAKEQDTLLSIGAKLGLSAAEFINSNGEEVHETTFDQDLAQYEVKDKVAMHARGIVTSSVEVATELYTGDLLKALGKGVARGSRATGLTGIIEKIPGKNKFLSSVSGKIENIQGAYLRSKPGRLLNAIDTNIGALANIQGKKAFGGIGEEIAEEYVAAFASAPIAFVAGDEDPLQELKHAVGGLDFAGQVGFQTMLIKGLFGGASAGSTLARVGYHSAYKKGVSTLDNKVKALEQRLKDNPEETDTKTALIQARAERAGFSNKYKSEGASATYNYLQSRKQMQNTVDGLRRATTDAEVSSLLDALHPNTTSEEKLLKATELRSENTPEAIQKAELIEDSIDRRTMAKALSTGTENELALTVKNLLKNKDNNLGGEQVQRLTKMEKILSGVVEFKKANSSNAYTDAAVPLVFEKLAMGENPMGQIVAQRGVISTAAENEFSSFLMSRFPSLEGTERLAADLAFSTGTLEDTHPEIYEAATEMRQTSAGVNFVHTTMAGYLNSFGLEQEIRRTVADLDMSIAETLNPTPVVQAKSDFIKDYQKYYDAWTNNDQDTLEELGLTTLEFHPNNSISNTSDPKVAHEILEKLSEKFVSERKLDAAQLGSVQTRVKSELGRVFQNKAVMDQMKQQALANAAAVLPVETAPSTIADTSQLEDTTVVVDVDAVAEFQEIIGNAMDGVTPASNTENIPFDPTSNFTAASEDAFDLSISLTGKPEYQAHLEMLTKAFTFYREWLPANFEVSFEMLMNEIFKAGHPSVKILPLIKAWEELGYKKLSQAQVEWAIQNFNKPDLEFLSSLDSIFETTVVGNPTEVTNQEIIAAGTNGPTEGIVVEVLPVQVVPAVEDVQNPTEEEVEQVNHVLTHIEVIAQNILNEGYVETIEEARIMALGNVAPQQVLEPGDSTSHTPFLGYLAINYDVQRQDNGDEYKVTRTGAQLNNQEVILPNGETAIRAEFEDLIHPDMYLSGATFTPQIAPQEDWNRITTTSTDPVTGAEIIVSFQQYYDERVKQDPSYPNSEVFWDEVPMFILDKAGKRLAHIHNMSWYTTRSIPNPDPSDMESTQISPSQLWKDEIEAYKRGNKALREAVRKGLTKVTLNKPTSGVFNTLPIELPLISIAESNPQALLSVQTVLGKTNFVNGLALIDKGFNKGTSILLNQEKDFEKDKREEANIGHTWAVYRIGSVEIDGKVVKTYHAVKTNNLNYGSTTSLKEEQLESVRWVLEAANRGSRYNPNYTLTPEQKKQIRDTIMAKMQIDISNAAGLMKYINSFMAASPGTLERATPNPNGKPHSYSSYAPYIEFLMKTDMTFEELTFEQNGVPAMFRQTTSKDTLSRNKAGVVTVANGVAQAVMENGKPLSYKDFIMRTLNTNLQAFNVAAPGKPEMYSIVLQPKLEITYAAEDIPGEKTSLEITTTQAIETVTAQAVGNTLPATEPAIEVTPQNLADTISFLSTLQVSIDAFEISDDLFGSIEELQAMFNLNEGLSLSQEKGFTQFIKNKMIPMLGIKAKITKSDIQKMRIAIEPEFREWVGSIKTALESHLTLLEKASFTDPKLAPTLAALRATLQVSESVLGNFDSLFTRTFNLVERETKVTFEEEDVDTEVEDLEKEKNYSQESLEEKVKDKASARLKMLLYGIPAVTFKTNPTTGKTEEIPVTGFFGVNTTLTLDEVYNLMLKTLGATSDVPASFDAIIAKLEKSENSAIKEVVKRFKGLDPTFTVDQQLRNQLVNNVTSHSLSSKFVAYTAGRKGVAVQLYNTNSSEITRQIRDIWLNNSAASTLYDASGAFNKTVASDLIKEYEDLVHMYSESLNPESKLTTEQTVQLESKLRGWLAKTGITLHNKTWETLYSGKGLYIKDKVHTFGSLFEPTGAYSLYGKIEDFLKLGVASTKEDEFSLDQDMNFLKNINNISKALAELEANYNPELISLSFRDTGKNIFSMTPPKYITDRIISLIEEDSPLVQDLLKTSYSKNSLLLNLLDGFGQTSKEMRELLRVHHVSLSAIKDMSKTSGQGGIEELSSLDYDMFAFGAFADRRTVGFTNTTVSENGIPLRTANMMAPTMSDKNQAILVTVPVLDLMKTGAVEVVEGENIYSEELLNDLVHYLVSPELERILNFYSRVKQTGIKDYDNGAKVFHTIPALNSLPVQVSDKTINLAEYLTSGVTIEEVFNNEALMQSIKDLLEEVINTEVERKTVEWGSVAIEQTKAGQANVFMDSKYFEEGGKKPVEDFKLGIMDFVVNNLVFQSEMTKTFTGDIANFSQDKVWKSAIAEANKRDKRTATDSHTIATLSAQDYLKANKKIGINLGKRLAYLIAPGKKIAESVGEQYYQIFLKDPVEIAENSLQLIDLFYDLSATEKSQVENKLKEFHNTVEQISDLQERMDLTPEEILEKTQTLPAKLEALRRELKDSYPKVADYFDIESADAQEYTTAAEHVNILFKLGRMSVDQHDRISRLLAEGKDLENTEEHNDLEIVMQPIKPVHTGSYTSVKEGEEAGYDMTRVVYVKSSSFPLLPQLTRGKKLDGLRVAMENFSNRNKKHVRASYQTANKVGAAKNTIDPLDAISLSSLESFSDNPNSNISSPVMLLDRNNFRIQQDVPFKSAKKKQDTVAMGTQIFKLLFGDGIINEGEVFEWEGKKVSGATLSAKYTEAFKGIIETERDKLYEELGLSSEGEIVDDAAFMIKVKEMLQKEAIDRGFPIKEVRGLSLTALVDNLGNTSLDFVIPLWLSPNSNKYEALFNSIFTNRVMQFKIPGNGFIAGSESGFKRTKKTMEDLDPSTKDKIIYLPGWNGTELQGTKIGEDGVQRAQVMIASKFKDASNKLVDLYQDYNSTTEEGKYIKKDEKGNLTLKTEMFDPQLLNLFSFRTPTSSHVSGSSIEIVGILPPASGDLMIVPKNFTKQKGLDFDIDKESAYGYNHYVASNGAIKLIDQEYLDGVMSGDIRVKMISDPNFDIKEYYAQRKLHFTDRKSALDKIKTVRGGVRNLIHISNEVKDLNFAKSLFESFNDKGTQTDTIEYIEKELETLFVEQAEIEAAMEQMFQETGSKSMTREEYVSRKEKVEAQYTAELEELEKDYKNYIEQNYLKEIKKKIHQNNFVKAHLAVYNSTSKKVQQKINKVLSMSVAQGQAEVINEIVEGTTADPYFTMFNSSYQKGKLDLGSVGKMAIGVYAVATTFNGLLQTTFKGKPALIGDGTFTIGNYKSLGIGQEKSLTVNPQYKRDTAEIFAEKENTATDNEKEQILARVGVNEQTIGVDALMTMRGFDLGEKGNSIPYLLISQKSVREYNQKLKNSKGILGEFVDNEVLIANTVEKLSGGRISYAADETNPLSGKMHFWEVDGAGNQVRILGPGSDVLTEDVLLAGVQGNAEEQDYYQALAFMTYIQLSEESAKLIPMMSALNTNALGKSVPEALLKKERLVAALNNESFFKDYYKLYGTKSANPSPGAFPVVKDTPLGPIVTYYTPTTPQGLIATTGLNVAEKLYNRLFIYGAAPIQETIKEVLNIQGKKPEYVTAKDYEDVVKEIKKYLYSNPNLFGTFENASTKRHDLFKDTSSNTSLSKYLQDIVKVDGPAGSKGVQLLRNSSLFSKRLRYKVGKGEGEVSTILFNTAVSDAISEEELYSALPELVMENLPLPDRNGKPYTTRDLVEDMVIYSFLEGGIQEATQFIKYVPIELLSSMGHINDSGEFVSVSQMLRAYQPTNSAGNLRQLLGMVDIQEDTIGQMSGVVTQIIQNNPTMAKRVPFKNVELFLDKGEMKIKSKADAMGVMVPAASELPFYFYQDKKTKKIFLFKSVGNGLYKLIPSNNFPKISQYSLGQNMLSNLDDTTDTPALPTATESGAHSFQYIPGMSITDALAQISLMSMPAERVYLKNLANFLVPNQNNKTGKLKVNNELAGRGAARGMNVTLSENYLNDPLTTNSLVAETLIHEVIHTLSVTELNKYFGEDGKGNYMQLDPTQTLPKAVQDLVNVYNQFLASSLINEETVEKVRAATKASGEDKAQVVKSLLSTWKGTDEDLQMHYAAVNIKEFMAILFQSKEFRASLNTLEYKQTGKSLLDKVLDSIYALVKNIFVTENLAQDRLAYNALVTSFKFMEEVKTIAPIEVKSLPLDNKNIDSEIPNVEEMVFGTEETGPPQGFLDNLDEEDDGTSYDMSVDLWNSLTEAEKEKIKECN